MPKNLTLAMPDELSEKMDRLKEVNWSAVARQGIEEYVERRQDPNLTPILERLSKQKNEQYKKGLETATTIASTESYAELDELFTKYEKEFQRQFPSSRPKDIFNLASLGVFGLTNNPSANEVDKYRIMSDVLKSLGMLNEDKHFTTEFLHGLYDGLIRFKDKLGI